MTIHDPHTAPTHEAIVSIPVPALSTMWAVQPRFEHDLGAFMERAQELGYAAIEVNHSMSAEQAGAILGYGTLPVTSVHAPAPLEKHPSAGWNRSLNLAALDEDERALSVSFHRRSIDLAAEAGGTVVVVHLGGVDRRLLTGERRLRSMYGHRERLPEEWEQTAAATVKERATIAAPWLEQARRSLEELAETAEARGVTLGIETRLHYHEIPLPHEAVDLFAPYDRLLVGYVHDVGHAEVQHRLGLTDRDAWFDLLGERLAVLHLHDVRGILDHRAPGNGDVDFTWLARRVQESNPAALRTFEIDQREPDEDVARGLEVLREAGVVGAG
jgi:sugar phosphate isomerase/epimerase